MLGHISACTGFLESGLSWCCAGLQSLGILLRGLKLQALTQATKWRSPQEQPKVAIYQDRTVAVCHSLIHLPAISTALLLVMWNSCGFLIGQLPSSTATSLQFPAKIFELLMQTSLATVLLGTIRRCITQSVPIPLGSVLAPASVTSVSYLWSLEFLGFLKSAWQKRSKHAALAAFTTLTVLLAAVVGPSGAVLMIPRSIEYLYFGALIYAPAEPYLYPMVLGIDQSPQL